MKVKGSITHLLLGSNIDKKSLIGKPINDRRGNKIGTITSIDIDKDNWYGEINDVLAAQLICRNTEVLLSFESK